MVNNPLPILFRGGKNNEICNLKKGVMTFLRKIKKRYTLGKAQELWKCCREIRYAGMNPFVGKVISGYNTNREVKETWVVLKVSKEWSNHIVQQLFEINPSTTTTKQP